MRLDKYLCDALGATRKQATKIIKSGEVTVDGEVQKSGAFKVPEGGVVEWEGREVGAPTSLHHAVQTCGLCVFT